MLLTVDLKSSQPLHDQLAGQIRNAIASGNPAPGDKLPPAKELAKSLGVNMHTMLRAHRTLQEEGLLEVRRGRGTLVTNKAPEQVDLIAIAQELVRAARHTGLVDEDIRQVLEGQL